MNLLRGICSERAVFSEGEECSESGVFSEGEECSERGVFSEGEEECKVRSEAITADDIWG